MAILKQPYLHNKERFLDLRVFQTLVRPQYEYSCSISSITSAFRYLTGEWHKQKEIAELLAVDIKGPHNPGNRVIVRWVKTIADKLNYDIRTNILFSSGWAPDTEISNSNWDMMTKKLKDENSFIILHIEAHYAPILGFSLFKKEAKSEVNNTTWIFLADPSPYHDQSKIESQHWDLSPPIWTIRWDEIGDRFKKYKNYAMIEIRKV